MKKCVILIPAYNPPKEFVKYAKEINKVCNFDLIVINDGSRDEFNPIFAEIGILKRTIVINHEVNKGKGRGLKTGFEYFCNNYEKKDVSGIVTADCDGQHLVKDIINISKKLEEVDDKTMVLGCRNFNLSNVPIKSSFGNKTTTEVFKILYGKLITDTQTGLRGLSYDFAKDCIDLHGERFEYEINMLIYATKLKVNICEVEIETVYFDNNSETHFHPIKDSIKIYKVMFTEFFKFIFSGLTSSILDLVMFTLIYYLLKNNISSKYIILVSTFGARAISSLYNYLMNRNIVFKSNNSNTLVKYYSLCIVQAFLSWFFVDKLFDLLKVSTPTIVKIFVDLVLFMLSYQIQQRFVFRRKSIND